MMNTSSCSFPGDRDEAIVDYLYGEGAGDGRRAFEIHLERCRVCRQEIEALGGVRQALTQWAPPEPRRALEAVAPRVGPRLAQSAPPVVPTSLAGWRAMPGWAQAAVAVLCVGIAAGAANLRVTYGTEGLSMSTGWLRSESPAPAPPATPPSEAAPWRTELTALGDALRTEIKQVTIAPAAAREPTDAVNEALLRQIRTLISQSEQRQQRELALRIGDALNDVQAQRRADLSKIDRTIGLIQNNTGMEVMRQREMLNSLAVRVSTQRP